MEHDDAGLARLEGARGSSASAGSIRSRTCVGRLLAPATGVDAVVARPRGVLLGEALGELREGQPRALARRRTPAAAASGSTVRPVGLGDVRRGLRGRGPGRWTTGAPGASAASTGAAAAAWAWPWRQRDVGVPLGAALRVPVGLAVPEQDQRAGVSTGAALGGRRRPGSSINGQSRHSRSRA